MTKPRKGKITGKRVLCHFCKKPIHIDKWGGICRVNKKVIWFCNNIGCLVELVDLRKKYGKEVKNKNDKKRGNRRID